MRLLAFETGQRRLSVAAWAEGRSLLARHEDAPQRHLERLAPMLDGVLRELGWEAGGLDAVAVSSGPGSFTGVRSALALAQGLALGGRCKLYAVPTLHAWASACVSEGRGLDRGRAAVWLDARRGMVFRALLRWQEGWVDLKPQAMLPLAEASAELEGVDWAASDLPAASLPAGLPLAPLPQAADLAEAVADVGWRRLLAGDPGLQPRELDALYLRRSEAELLWEQRHPPALPGN